MPRVKAGNEDMAKHLRHPITKLGFAGDINATVNWPDDTFTNRRIRDGDVVVVEDQPEQTKNDKRAKRDEGGADISPPAGKPFTQ